VLQYPPKEQSVSNFQGAVIVVRRRKSPKSLTNLSIAELQDLLEKRIARERKKLPALQKKRDKLAGQLEEINTAIVAIEGSEPSRRGAVKRRGGKPGKRTSKITGTFRETRGGKMTIPAAIHKVLEEAGTPMKSSEIRDAILKKKLTKGAKKSFPAQVNIALNRRKEFKKKGRGVYSL
jgi:hypothetical protein